MKCILAIAAKMHISSALIALSFAGVTTAVRRSPRSAQSGATLYNTTIAGQYVVEAAEVSPDTI